MEERSATYKSENLRLLRRTLKMTQKDFIARFLSAEDGSPTMSIATLSNLESKGGIRLDEVISAVSEALDIDVMAFSLPAEEFAAKVHFLLPERTPPSGWKPSESKKRDLTLLLNRLTMYFAEQLFDKNLKKGDKIESDRELAVRFGVGRSVIREALKVLGVLGMIDIRPGQGTYISNNVANFFVIPLSWSLFLNRNQVESIIEVRNVLEVKAAYLAAKNKNSEDLNKLHEISHIIHNAYIAKDYKTFLEADLEFHICIAECSGNQVIYSMIQTISNLMRHVSGTGMVGDVQLQEIYDEHQKIYGLILASDAKGAAGAMEEHLSQSLGRYNYR